MSAYEFKNFWEDGWMAFDGQYRIGRSMMGVCDENDPEVGVWVTGYERKNQTPVRMV